MYHRLNCTLHSPFYIRFDYLLQPTLYKTQENYNPTRFIHAYCELDWEWKNKKQINSNLFDCLVVENACVFTIHLSQVAFGKIDF